MAVLGMGISTFIPITASTGERFGLFNDTHIGKLAKLLNVDKHKKGR